MSQKSFSRVFHDPIHGNIKVNAIEAAIIDSPFFQRLRYVKQNSTAYLTYPTAVGSRFEHSIGCMHIAGKMIDSLLIRLWRRDDGIKTKILQQARDAGFYRSPAGSKRLNEVTILFRISEAVKIAALCHDIGHLPFSHVLEIALTLNSEAYDKVYGQEITRQAMQEKRAHIHEYATIQIFKEYIIPLFKRQSEGRVVCELAFQILNKMDGSRLPLFATLHEILDSDLDADRCDFIARDGQMAGLGLGTFDIDRIAEALWFYYDKSKERFSILPLSSCTSAAEGALVQRYWLYKWLVNHHKVVFTDAVLSRLVRILVAQAMKPRASGLGKLVDLSRFHYSRYVQGGEFFDDVYLLQVLRSWYVLLQKRAKAKPNGEDNFTICLLEMLLHRNNRAISVWKTREEYCKKEAKIFELLATAIRRRHKEKGGSLINITTDVNLRVKPLLNTFSDFFASLESTFEVDARGRLDERLQKVDKNVNILFQTKTFKPYSLRILSSEENEPMDVGQWSKLAHELGFASKQDTHFFLYLIASKKKESVKSNEDVYLKKFAECLADWYLNDPGVKVLDKNDIYQDFL